MYIYILFYYIYIHTHTYRNSIFLIYDTCVTRIPMHTHPLTIHTYTHIHIHTHNTNTHTNKYTPTYTCIHKNIPPDTYIHTQIHIHTHTHTWQVHMTCVHKNNQPAYFVCYVRHADPNASLTAPPLCGRLPESHEPLHTRLVQEDFPYKNFLMPLDHDNEVMEDPEMDQVFEALSSAQVELPF
jgi:hypothetical protein